MPKRLRCCKRSLDCGRLTSSKTANKLDAPQTVPIWTLFICLTMFTARIKCSSDGINDTPPGATTNDWLDPGPNTNPTNSELTGESLSSEQRLLMSTRLPRQHFRLNVMPSTGKSNFKLVKIQRSRARSKKPTSSTSSSSSITTTTSTTSSTTTPMSEQVQRLDGVERATPKPRLHEQEKKLPKGQGKKISSAVLRKLLNQTLPKLNASNNFAATTADNKMSGFKFVFIQRGNQAPAFAFASASTSEPTKTRPVSLAANMSRQLADSLLYSAASLVANLSSVSSATGASSMPSLSTSSRDELSNELAPSSPATSSTTQRPSTSVLEQGDPVKATAISGEQQHSSTSSNSKPTRRPRPSKIYNLPVKFVSNGQPNHVMFHAIKQHFATIKRLQQSVNMQLPSYSTSGNAASKRKKTHNQNDRTRQKGKNSRFIHLPLKYLSNARPNLVNVIMGTKASHKLSSSALSSASVSPS